MTDMDHSTGLAVDVLEELGEGVHLVVMPALRERHQLQQIFVEPGWSLRSVPRDAACCRVIGADEQVSFVSNQVAAEERAAESRHCYLGAMPPSGLLGLGGG